MGKTAATNGPGSLSLSNLSFDLGAKAIYADVLGANGVGSISRYAVWTFDTLLGASPLVPAGTDLSGYASGFGLQGLFAPAAAMNDVFYRALNLNNTGKSFLTSVNTRTSTNTDGFGRFDVSYSRIGGTSGTGPDTTPSGLPTEVASPVAEPSGAALALAAVGCVGFRARRHSLRVKAAS